MESVCQARQTGGIYRTSQSNLASDESRLEGGGHRHYSIWLADGEVFGYYECEKGAAYAAKVQSESPVVDRWNEYMKDVMEMKKDEKTGAQPLLQEVFYLP